MLWAYLSLLSDLPGFNRINLAIGKGIFYVNQLKDRFNFYGKGNENKFLIPPQYCNGSLSTCIFTLDYYVTG